MSEVELDRLTKSRRWSSREALKLYNIYLLMEEINIMLDIYTLGLHSSIEVLDSATHTGTKGDKCVRSLSIYFAGVHIFICRHSV